MNAQENNKRGFTIIEVVLVLAIAALIFLMVFIALPALQRNQRDTARRNDASAVSSAMNSFRTNNRGNYGTGFTTTELRKYVDRLDQYDVGDINVVAAGTNQINFDGNENNVYAKAGAKCPGTLPTPGDTTISFVTQGVSSRVGAVAVMLENNGTDRQIFCQDA